MKQFSSFGRFENNPAVHNRKCSLTNEKRVNIELLDLGELVKKSGNPQHHLIQLRQLNRLRASKTGHELMNPGVVEHPLKIDLR